MLTEDFVENSYTSASNEWNLNRYIKSITIHIINENEDGLVMELDIINTEAPIANALRRILIAEIPTMAIEKVYLYQNTSCIQVGIHTYV